MKSYPQDNFVPDHHTCTDTQKSKLTEKLHSISGSVSDFTQLSFNKAFNSLSKIKLSSLRSGSAWHLNLNPEVARIHQSYLKNQKNLASFKSCP